MPSTADPRPARARRPSRVARRADSRKSAATGTGRARAPLRGRAPPHPPLPGRRAAAAREVVRADRQDARRPSSRSRAPKAASWPTSSSAGVARRAASIGTCVRSTGGRPVTSRRQRTAPSSTARSAPPAPARCAGMPIPSSDPAASAAGWQDAATNGCGGVLGAAPPGAGSLPPRCRDRGRDLRPCWRPIRLGVAARRSEQPAAAAIAATMPPRRPRDGARAAWLGRDTHAPHHGAAASETRAVPR